MKSKQLVRQFIHESLYHPQQGYFTTHSQLGALKQPIDFRSLLGYEDYMNALQTNYPDFKWLTPSEVFRPYYGITIGNYIHQQYLFTRKQKLRIVEVGAGYGAACEGILHYFRNYSPEIFSQLEYHIVELSPSACTQAKERLEQEFSPQIRKGNLRIFNQDILEYQQMNQKNEIWFFLFLEVFDNLPHDKIINGQQVYVENMKEYLEPISDPLIKETYALYKEYKSQQPNESHEKEQFLMKSLRKVVSRYYGNQNNDALFLPTVSLQVLKHIKKHFYNPSLVIADFDMLKNEYTQNAINSPIVSRKLKDPHEKEDFESYLVERGQADIFFPTEFLFVQHMVKKIFDFDSKIFKAYAFADEFSKNQWTTTQSGYNPLKEDFGNTSFLVSDHS